MQFPEVPRSFCKPPITSYDCSHTFLWFVKGKKGFCSDAILKPHLDSNNPMNEEFVPALRRNTLRNTRKSGDEVSNERSTGVEDCLEDGMEAIDFVVDKYESGDKLEVNYKKDKLTIQASSLDFSILREQGENILSTVALTTTFDDDVKKYSVFKIPEDDGAFQNMCRSPIG